MHFVLAWKSFRIETVLSSLLLKLSLPMILNGSDFYLFL